MESGTTLADWVGCDRDTLVAAWCLLLIERKVQDGYIEGRELDYSPARRVVEVILAAGVEPPTLEEVRYGLVFCHAAYPEFRLTAKGEAAAAFFRMQRGMAQG